MKRQPSLYLLTWMLLLTLLLGTASVFATNAPPVTEALTTSPPKQEPELVPPALNRCRAGGVCNAETGEILYSVNETTAMYPAAATKLMTALVVLEHYADRLDTDIKITATALEGASGVNANLQVGETLTVRQLLACVVVASANDAALVLARNVAGSLDDFVERMNEKADRLGMYATEYRNPTGLHHSQMVTTVADTLRLAIALYRNSEFLNLSARKTFEIPVTEKSDRRLLHNRNYLVSDRGVQDYYDSSVNGMCYGSTYEAGGVSVASSEHDGTVYIAVVFGGQTESVPIEGTDATKVLAHALFEVKSLLDWAKESFTYFLIADTSDIICEIPVKLGDGRNHVTLFPAQRIELYLPTSTGTDSDIRTEYTLTEASLTAPITAGTVAGTLSVYHRGQLVAQVDLVTRSTVDRSILDYYSEQALAFVTSAQFRKWALIGVIALAAYALLMSVWRYHARKRALLRRRREHEEEIRRKERARLEQWKE